MQPQQADYTPVSTLSLRELRSEMLQRAAATASRARACRARGDLATARVLEQKAAKMAAVARSVNVS
ncbi:hypothetical protein BH23ACT9_BH23ACT9_33780 [soil metagenome]